MFYLYLKLNLIYEFSIGELYRMDRNCQGGGLIFSIRSDIPSKDFHRYRLLIPSEGCFAEINLRKKMAYLLFLYY